VREELLRLDAALWDVLGAKGWDLAVFPAAKGRGLDVRSCK
jgi:hypothetical protein